MFCAYCHRLFSFQQPVQQYEPAQKRRRNVLQEQGSSNDGSPQLKIEQASLHQVTRDKLEIEVYEDTRSMFTPKLLWFKAAIPKEGLKTGETHDPKGACLICGMVFSDVSGSFVEAVLRKQSGKGASEIGFVYQLKRTEAFINLREETVLSVWLEAGEKLVPMIKLKISAANYSKQLPGVFPSRVESTNTGSLETLKLAASWINHCKTTHRECARLQAQGHRFPTRLIDVGTTDGSVKPHLYIPSPSTPFTPYTTLSYRWGPSPAILLTQTSLSPLLEEIPLHLLPKSNQDAIQVTRFLGIRFLWIDALCIIQDLEDDWHKESERMGDIYKGSYVTISASMAETGNMGCFVERGPLQASFGAGRKDEGGSGSLSRNTSQDLIRPRSESSVVVTTPDQRLMRRRLRRYRRHHGSDPHKSNVLSDEEKQLWQEPISKGIESSPSDHFRQQPNDVRSTMRFERYDPIKACSYQGPEMTIRTFQTNLWTSEIDASPLSRRAWTLQERLLSSRILHFGKSQLFFECPYSRACETWPQPVMRRIRQPFEEDSPVGFKTAGPDASMNGAVVHPLSEHWDEIVELYMDTNLTRPEDKLVAISGLAREVQKETKDVYYAGLWRREFERTLLWYLHVPQRMKIGNYRAPSWSWASVDGKVGFLANKPGRTGDETSSVATIHTIRTAVKDGQQSSTGQLKDGFCRISGTLRKVLRYERQATTHRLVLSEELSDPHCYVEFYPDTMTRKEDFPADVECLLILHYRNRTSEDENPNKENGTFLAGLVIQPTGEFTDEYQRIGVFRIAEESGKYWFQGAGSEEREVTII